MTYRTLTYRLDGAAATITLNQPETLNAFTAEMRGDLAEAIAEAAGEARALVITGAGRGFCAGQDLGDLAQPERANLERLLEEEYHPILKAIVDCPIPTICAVNGIAAGAGANLALATDLTIAAGAGRVFGGGARGGGVAGGGGGGGGAPPGGGGRAQGRRRGVTGN
ncbi:MAG: enoyl-CoA hydratase-related protein, partial [Pseudomonadota bacterium]